MSHTTIYNPQAHIVEIKAQGDLSLNEAKEIISEAAQILAEQECFLVLSDFREATMKLSTVDIYELPKILSGILASLGLSAYKYKRALVVGKNAQDFHFFETVTVNNGQWAKLFYDIDDAKAWLFEK